MIQIAIVLSLALIETSCAGRPAAMTQTHSTRDFALGLQAVEPRIRAGTAPRFRLTLTNISEHTCRLVNAARVDLQHNYYNLVVTQSGTNIWVGRGISDPGPIGDTDWLAVPSHEGREFVLTNFPDAWDRLVPGDYEAYVDSCPDPHQSHTACRYRSGIGRFTVTR